MNSASFREVYNSHSTVIMRFIYLYLGSRMAFDSKFTFGNTKERRSIYNRSINSKDALNKNLESNTNRLFYWGRV